MKTIDELKAEMEAAGANDVWSKRIARMLDILQEEGLDEKTNAGELLDKIFALKGKNPKVDEFLAEFKPDRETATEQLGYMQMIVCSQLHRDE